MKTFKMMFYVVFALYSLQISANDRANELIDKYFEAVGGKEAWRAIDSIEEKGLMFFDDESLSMKQLRTKDGKSAEWLGKDCDLVKVAYFDGDELAQREFSFGIEGAENKIAVENGELVKQHYQLSPKAGDMLETSKQDVWYQTYKSNRFPSALLGYKEKGYTISYDGTKGFLSAKDDSKLQYLRVVTLTTRVDSFARDFKESYYFDPVSNLLIAESIEHYDGTSWITEYSDYQSFDDIQIPTEQISYLEPEEFYSDKEALSSFIVERVFINKPLKGDEFEFYP